MGESGAESEVGLDELMALAREELRQEYHKIRDVKVKLWRSGFELERIRRGEIPPWRE